VTVPDSWQSRPLPVTLGYMSTMTAQAAATGAVTRPRRMLRPVIVAPSLLDLHGPWVGVLELPQRLCWSLDAEQRRFDLGDLDRVASAYEYVLDAARTPADLADHLNGWLLAAAWDRIGLDRRKRAAWEAAHPLLRHRGAAAA
jgi:hypothetical protein